MSAVRKWLSCFGLGFWSWKKTGEAGRRGYGNLFFSFLLALVLLVMGVFAADLVPFRVHYRNAGTYRAFIADALTPTEDSPLVLTLSEGRLSAMWGADGEIALIDSVSDSVQAERYGANGYHLVIDTRPADALDDFEAYYLANDGTGQEISVEEYETLSEVARRNFDFKIRYTGRELILTEELVLAYETYLAGQESALSALNEIRSARDTDGEDAYRRKVYTLYVKTRYPSMTTYETNSEVPLLRNYYMYDYVNSGRVTHYLFLFCDAVIGAFATDGGHEVNYYGFYPERTGDVIPKSTANADARSLSVAFVEECFYEATPFYLYLWVTGFMQLLLYLMLLPLVVGLLFFCLVRLLRVDPQRSFGVCQRQTGIWLWQAAFLTGCAVFALGFLVPRRLLQPLTLLIFFCVLLVRAGVQLLFEKRHPAPPAGSTGNAPTRHLLPEEDLEL